MLGQAHAVADDHPLGPGIDVGERLDVGAGQAGALLDAVPGRGPQVGRQRFEAVRVPGDEGAIEQARSARRQVRRIGFEQGLHDALEHRHIAADLRLEVGRGDRHRATGQHLRRLLRRSEAFQPALGQRVEHHDRHPAQRHLAQGAQHARMVGAGVVADAEHGISLLEVVERYGALAHADRGRQADAGGFVAQVRAVGEVVAAVLAHEELVQERGLVGSAPRCVELGHGRIGQLAQRGPDARRRILPGDRQVFVLLRVVGHRMAEAALVLERVVGPFPEFGQCVACEEPGCRASGGSFPGHRLGAVLAELERGGMARIGPGATGAVEARRLVHPAQRPGRTRRRHLLANRPGDRAQRPPAAGRTGVGLDALVDVRFGTGVLGRCAHAMGVPGCLRPIIALHPHPWQGLPCALPDRERGCP